MDHASIIKQSQCWLQDFVIKLNLCPFAHQPLRQGRVRFVVSPARSEEQLLQDLLIELRRLASTPSEELETTLLIHPWVLKDFLLYNDFLDVVDALLLERNYEGVFQVASLHPDYQFAESEYDDAANYTNRSPFPMLHLLREESLTRVLEKYPEPERIPERNIEIMNQLGRDALQRMLLACSGEQEEDS